MNNELYIVSINDCVNKLRLLNTTDATNGPKSPRTF